MMGAVNNFRVAPLPQASTPNPKDGAALVSQDQDANSLDGGRLTFGQTYYWRVDEVNSAPCACQAAMGPLFDCRNRCICSLKSS
jgi:hypothetical protein